MKDFKTEAEAHKIRCHLSFATGPIPQVVGIGPIHPPAFCIASQCMAWRWSHQDTGAHDPPTGFCGAAVLPKYI